MKPETKLKEKDPYLPLLTGQVREYTFRVLERAVGGVAVPAGWKSALRLARYLLARDAAKHIAALFPQDWWVLREASGQRDRWNIFVAGENGKADHKRFVATFCEETDARRLVEDHNRPLGEMSGLLGEIETVLATKGDVDWP